MTTAQSSTASACRPTTRRPAGCPTDVGARDRAHRGQLRRRRGHRHRLPGPGAAGGRRRLLDAGPPRRARGPRLDTRPRPACARAGDQRRPGGAGGGVRARRGSRLPRRRDAHASAPASAARSCAMAACSPAASAAPAISGTSRCRCRATRTSSTRRAASRTRSATARSRAHGRAVHEHGRPGGRAPGGRRRGHAGVGSRASCCWRPASRRSSTPSIRRGSSSAAASPRTPATRCSVPLRHWMDEFEWRPVRHGRRDRRRRTRRRGGRHRGRGAREGAQRHDPVRAVSRRPATGLVDAVRRQHAGHRHGRRLVRAAASSPDGWCTSSDRATAGSWSRRCGRDTARSRASTRSSSSR